MKDAPLPPLLEATVITIIITARCDATEDGLLDDSDFETPTLLRPSPQQVNIVLRCDGHSMTVDILDW